MDREYHVTRQQKVGGVALAVLGAELTVFSLTLGGLIATLGLAALAALCLLRNLTRFIPAAGRYVSMRAGAAAAAAAGTLAAVLALAAAIACIVSILILAGRNARRTGGRLARLPSVNLVPRLAAAPAAAQSAS